jgi:hypothetical protein
LGDRLYTKDERIKLEARNSKIVGKGQFIEPAPKPGDSLERQSRHDLDLPGVELALRASRWDRGGDGNCVPRTIRTHSRPPLGGFGALLAIFNLSTLLLSGRDLIELDEA